MALGARYDLAAAKEAARLKKQKDLVKQIVSNVVLVVVLLLTALGVWLGVRWWREKTAREEAARQEVERQRAEARRIENEKRAEQRRLEAEKREQERKAHAEKVARERAEREAARERELAERQRQKEEAEARKEKERLEREEREKRAKFAKEFLAGLEFEETDHYVVELDLDGMLAGVKVADARWADLKAAVANSSSPVFFDLMRPASETNNEENVGLFPDENTMMNRRKALDREKFTLTVSLKPGIDGRFCGVYRFSVETGVAVLDSATEIRKGSRLEGWTVPFRFGGGANVLVMRNRTARQLQNEWRRQVRGVGSSVKTGETDAATVAEQRRKALEEFAEKVRVQLRAEPPKPAENHEKQENKDWRNRDDKDGRDRFGRGIRGFGRGGNSSGSRTGGSRSGRTLGGGSGRMRGGRDR